MRILFFICFLFLFDTCLAQEDYLILQKGDTINGTFRSMTSKNIRYRIGRERKKIPAEAIKEYFLDNKRYLIMKNPYRDAFVNFSIIEDGAVRLIRDIKSNFQNVYAVDFVILDGKLYHLDEPYLSDPVWDKLARCKTFADQFSAYKRNVLILNVPRSRKRWQEMIAFYNSQCE